MGFKDINYKGIRPSEYKKYTIEKVRKLYDNLNERSKAIKSSSTMDSEAIELTEITSKDIDTTVKCVEQGPSSIEAGERDKLLPLRELEGLDKQLRTIRGSMRVATAKRIDLEGLIKH